MHVRTQKAILDTLSRYSKGENISHAVMRTVALGAVTILENTTEELADLKKDYDQLFNSKQGGKWKKYDPNTPPEPERGYCFYGKDPGDDEPFCLIGTFRFVRFGGGQTRQCWVDGLNGAYWQGVTHYIEINLPECGQQGT